MPQIKYDLRKIPLEKLELWEQANVRKDLSIPKLQELAANIAENGLLHPLLTKYDKKDGKFKVFGGQRRLEACRSIQRSPVECYVFDNISEDNARLLSLSENLYREKMLTDDVAIAAHSLFIKYNKNQKKTADALGVTPETLRRYLDYYAVPESVKKLGEKLGIRKPEVTKVYNKFLSESKSLACLREFGKLTERNERINLKAAIREAKSTDSIDKIKKRAKQLMNSQKVELMIPNDVAFQLERKSSELNQAIQDTIIDIIEESIKGYH